MKNLREKRGDANVQSGELEIQNLKIYIYTFLRTSLGDDLWMTTRQKISGKIFIRPVFGRCRRRRFNRRAAALWTRRRKSEEKGKESAKEGLKGAARQRQTTPTTERGISARARLNFQRGRARLIYLPVQRSIVLLQPVESPWLFRDLERWRR